MVWRASLPQCGGVVHDEQWGLLAVHYLYFIYFGLVFFHLSGVGAQPRGKANIGLDDASAADDR